MDENDEDAVQSLNGGSSRFEKQRIFDLHNGNRNCRIFVVDTPYDPKLRLVIEIKQVMLWDAC